MLNASLIKGLIARRGVSGAAVAAAIGISPSTFYRKLKTGNFLLWEAEALMKALRVPKERAADLFFADKEARDKRGT